MLPCDELLTSAIRPSLPTGRLETLKRQPAVKPEGAKVLMTYDGDGDKHNSPVVSNNILLPLLAMQLFLGHCLACHL